MTKSLNTWLLAAGAIVMVALGAAAIVLAGAIGDDGGDAGAAAKPAEQDIYLLNLGMT